jgi:glycosyltransferase involved in cell wall biosynthesis
MKKIKILHIINSFEFGGAEAMLCNLAVRTDADRFETSVVALIDDLSVAGPILRAGIGLVTMGMTAGVPDPLRVGRLAGYLRRKRPDVIQTWMDHSNLIGGVAARLVSSAPVVWGVHHSNHIAEMTKRSTLLTVKACAMVSNRVPARIVYCSEHSRTLYNQRGFAADKAVVIPNGFDTSRFRPDSSARADVRRELGLAPDAMLVGLVARYDPLKDHATFLRAAAIVLQRLPEAHFVMCGTRVESANATLSAQIQTLGLSKHVHLLGQRRDVARIQASLDVLTSSSISEAFPLTVGEAMSCGVPCVATDVGDSALMVAECGRIVPPSDPAALAGALVEVLSLDADTRNKLGEAGRRRVCELFDLNAVTRRYESLYEQLTQRKPRRTRPDARVLPLTRTTASAA